MLKSIMAWEWQENERIKEEKGILPYLILREEGVELYGEGGSFSSSFLKERRGQRKKALRNFGNLALNLGGGAIN